MKSKTRKITIDGNVYIWTITTQIQPIADTKSFIAETRFTAYHSTNKRSPLRIIFTTWDDLITGNPLTTGWKTKIHNKEEAILNINHPGVARKLIAVALQQGWIPEKDNGQLTISDGLNILTEIGYDVESLRPHS